MNPYIEQLNAYLAGHTPDYGCADIQSLLDMLYFCYTEANPIRSGEISRGFREQAFLLRRLTPEELDRVCSLTCRLCGEHERTAFREGILVGARLARELEIP